MIHNIPHNFIRGNHSKGSKCICKNINSNLLYNLNKLDNKHYSKCSCMYSSNIQIQAIEIELPHLDFNMYVIDAICSHKCSRTDNHICMSYDYILMTFLLHFCILNIDDNVKCLERILNDGDHTILNVLESCIVSSKISYKYYIEDFL